MDLSFSRRSLLVSGVTAPWAFSAHADLYDEYINSRSKQPFVAFLAREISANSPGHAFVGIGVRLNANLQVYERFYGYYPDSNGKLAAVKMVLSKVSGRLDYRWADSSWTTEYLVNIDDDKRNAVLALTDEWKSSDPKYNLLASGGKNCSVFVGDVAKTIGLKVPGGAGTQFPPAYVAKLKKANGG